MKYKQERRNEFRERRRFPEQRTEAADAAWRLLRLAFYSLKKEEFADVSDHLKSETDLNFPVRPDHVKRHP